MHVDTRLIYADSQKGFNEFLSENFLSCKLLGVSSYVGGVVVPGPVGAVVLNNKYLVETMSYTVRCPEKFRVIPSSDKVVECNEEVLFLGSFESCWGHCITDNLKHLWILHSPLLEQYRSMKWVYAMELPEKGLPKNFIELLAVLGLNLSQLVLIDRPTKFNVVHVPDSCFYCDDATSQHYRYYTKEFVELVDCIVDTVDPARDCNPQRKVYLTRTGWKKGNPDFGERYVEKAFVAKGFEVVRPESLSFVETVRLMGQCKALAATEGSTAHNSIFLPKGSELVVVRKADYINEYQPPINQLRDLDVVYIDAHRTTLLASARCPFSGPFFIYCNENLAKYAGIGWRFPLVDWCWYVVFCIYGKLCGNINKYLARLKRIFRRLG